MPALDTLALAATILLLRDGRDGLEVFMVLRHHKIEFAAGALVFPGGRLDDADLGPAIAARFDGGDGLSSDEIASRVCGVRETFEEAGVLLARDAGGEDLLADPRAAAIGERYRARLHDAEITLAEIVIAENLRIAGDQLVRFSHWITPEDFPKRFDTQFYLAPAPAGQAASHDAVESVDSVWITPAQALADGAAGRRTVVFATRLNLQVLAASDTVQSAIAAAAATKIVTVVPRVRKVEGGRIFTIPEDAGYGEVEYFDPTVAA